MTILTFSKNNNTNNNENGSNNIEFIFQILISIILFFNILINYNNNDNKTIIIISIIINIIYQLYIKFQFTSNKQDENKLLVERKQSDWGLGLGISIIPNILLVILLNFYKFSKNNTENSTIITTTTINSIIYIISFYQITFSIISPLFLFNHISVYRIGQSCLQSRIEFIRTEYINIIKIYIVTFLVCFVLSFFNNNSYNISFIELSLYMFIFSFIFITITKQLLYKLPNSFTIGESTILSQFITLLLSESFRYFFNYLFIYSNINNNNNDKFNRINILYCFFNLIVGSLFIVFLISLFGIAKKLRILMTVYYDNSNSSSGSDKNKINNNILIKTVQFYFMVIGIILFIIYPILSKQLGNINPFMWVFEYIVESDQIKYIMGLWMMLLVFTIFSYQPSIHSSIPMIISRKYFHILAIIMFTPPLLLFREDMSKFMVLSYAVSISALILLELLKYSLALPLSLPIKKYMDRFLDSRDSGLITTTHIYLLLGCSIPLFLSFFMDLMVVDINGIELYNFLSPFSGILTIGVGDTMASYFGVKYGRNKWFGSSKSIEGTIAGSIFTILASLILNSFNDDSISFFSLLKITITSTSCSLLEASTNQIDNLILPLFYFILINL